MMSCSPQNAAGQGASVLATLKQKMQKIRDELDKYKDKYDDKCHELEIEKGHRNEFENEVQSLQRRVSILEDDNEQLEIRLQTAVQKLQETSKVLDDNERSRRSLESQQNLDDDKIHLLEEMLRATQVASNNVERKFDEAARKLVITETELERAEERAEVAEATVRHLDTDLRMITNSLKSVEISEQTLAHREETYEVMIADLNSRLREAEHNVEILSRELKCKQTDLDNTEGNLSEIQLHYKALRDEMDGYLHDLSSM